MKVAKLLLPAVVGLTVIATGEQALCDISAEIANPEEGEEYQPCCNITVDGTASGLEGKTLYIALKKGGANVQTTTAEVGEGYWQCEFEPPAEGWDVGDYVIKVRFLSADLDSVNIKVVQDQ
jgi:hypothetical protein